MKRLLIWGSRSSFRSFLFFFIGFMLAVVLAVAVQLTVFKLFSIRLHPPWQGFPWLLEILSVEWFR